MLNIVITYRYEKRKKVESLYGPRRNSISNLFFNPGTGGFTKWSLIKGQLRERLVVPRVQREEDQVRPDCSFAPTQLALCLRFALLKGESCYALS
jgi:hypothetical protein